MRMISKRSGKISAALFVLWAATMLWVLDTRVNFTHRVIKEGGCTCALAMASNRSQAVPDSAGSSSKVKTRTVVKWLNYCKDGNTSVPSDSKKADAPHEQPKGGSKTEEVGKHANVTTNERTAHQPVKQKPDERPQERQLQATQHQSQQRQLQGTQEQLKQRQDELPQQQQQQEAQHQELATQQRQQMEMQQSDQQSEQPQQQEPQQQQAVQQPRQAVRQLQQQSVLRNDADQKNFAQQQQQQPQKTAQELARSIQQQQSLEPLPSEKVINPHPYHFVMKNSDACLKGANNDGYVDVLCLVYTAPSDSYMRSLIRKTWGSAREVKGKRIVTMFLLGQRNLEIQQLIELENNLYHDIIQEDFTDSYYNLTIKTIMGLKWASQFCSNARFIVKMDIDMFVNVYNLVDRIDKVPSSGVAEGNRKDVTKPIRYKQSKWYTSKDVYPGDSYPPYLNGPAYLISADLAPRIYNASFTTQFLPWEDAFVGIIMKKLNIDPKYSGKYDTYLNYTDEQQTLRKIGGSITFHLGEDKDKNKLNIGKVWRYVRKLNEASL